MMTETSAPKDTSCNGWKNYQTWNVAVWVSNDEPLYRCASEYVARRRKAGKMPSWNGFCHFAGLIGDKTPDGCAWAGTRLDRVALNAMMREWDQ